MAYSLQTADGGQPQPKIQRKSFSGNSLRSYMFIRAQISNYPELMHKKRNNRSGYLLPSSEKFGNLFQ